MAGLASPSPSDRWSHTKALSCLVNLKLEYNFQDPVVIFVMSQKLEKKKISNYLRYIVLNKYSRDLCGQCP